MEAVCREVLGCAASVRVNGGASELGERVSSAR